MMRSSIRESFVWATVWMLGFSCQAQEESRYTYRIKRILKEGQNRELKPQINSTEIFSLDDFATNVTDIDFLLWDENSTKSGKMSKSSKSTKASTSKSTKSTKAPSQSKSTKAPTSKSGKGGSNSKSSSKSSKKSGSADQTDFTGTYVGLADYSKSCSSQGGCIKDLPAFCSGGMDVVQEFDVNELGLVQVSMDIVWDFARSPSTCATITSRSDSLEGLGWIPIRASKSFRCFTEPLTGLPFSPNLGELFFSGTFSVKILSEDDLSLPGSILSGAVCELFNSEGIYTGVNSFLLVGIIPGYLVTLEYEYDDNSLQVLPLINGTPHITLKADDSFITGRWDQLLQQQQQQAEESLILRD